MPVFVIGKYWPLYKYFNQQIPLKVFLLIGEFPLGVLAIANTPATVFK